GYLRVTLNISFLQNLVMADGRENGSIAFVVDNNGVIIAHTDITQTMKAIAPFTSSSQQDIKTLGRYGTNTQIPILSYGALATEQRSNQQNITLQLVPPGQKESYQALGQVVPLVPWTYFVLRPTSSITALADQQLLSTAIIAVIVLMLAAIIGMVIGRQ